MAAADRDMREIFVEEGRVEHVDRLEQGYRDLTMEGSARPFLISLESRSGYGKTRVVQEFYRRIASEQAYWPDSLLAQHGGTQRARKRIGFTAFTKPQGAPLPFMWLALDCDLNAGTRNSGVGAVSRALRNHLPSVFAGGPTQGDLAAEAVDQLRAVGETIVGDALPALIPGAGTVVLGVEVVKSLLVRKALEREERAERRIDIDAGAARSVFGDLVRTHRKRPQLPFVLIVEDAHHADSPLIALIRLLLDPEQHARLPILVVTMAWPDQLARQENEARDGGTAESFGQLLVDLIEAGVPVDRRQLAPLGDDGLCRIFTSAAPNTTDRVLSALVQRCGGNPHMAGLLLELDDVRAAIRGGAIHLDPEEIRRLPTDVGATMQELWGQLPQDVQRVLALSAVQGREFVGPLTEHMAHLLPEPLHNPSASLAAAVAPYEWVRHLDNEMYVFFESYNHELALTVAQKSLWVEKTDATIARYVAEARQDPERWSEFASPVQDLLLALHVRVAGTTNPANAATSAHELFNRTRDWDTAEALHWAKRAIVLMRRSELMSHDQDATDTSSGFLASLKPFSRTHPFFMRDLAESQLDHSELLREPSSPELAVLLLMAGRTNDAATMALNLASRARPDDLTELIFVLSDAGRHDEALALSHQLFGKTAGSQDEQSAKWVQLLTHLQAERFEDLPLSAEDRDVQLLLLILRGDTDDATALAREQIRAAKTATSRRNARGLLATALVEADRFDEATAVRREQLAEAQPGAEWTEAAKALASVLDLAGREGEAIALRRTLLAEASSPDEVRDARRSLALMLMGPNHEDEYLRLRRQLYVDARSSDELREARTELITALLNAERWAESIPLLEEQLGAEASTGETATWERKLEFARERAARS